MYSPQLRCFALTLHYYSPRAYEFVRDTFKSCLPHPKTLISWYRSVDGEPGFTAEAFQAIKEKAAVTKQKIVFSLVIDEMAIRKKLEFDGKRWHGHVEFGLTANEEKIDDTMEEAKDALVMMLVAINAPFKVPVGYFMTSGVNAEMRASLVKNCLELCLESNIEVVSLTFDCTASNMSMARQLGCDIENLKVDFPHPANKEKTIYVYPDPSHLIKLLRNTYGEKRELMHGGNKILWEVIKKLEELQSLEGLRAANKLTKRHIQFYRHKMKVKLATQLFSRSVADALEMMQEGGNEEFEGAEETIKFIRFFDKLFDVCNSKHIRQLGWKKPINKDNWWEVSKFFDEADAYISELTFMEGGKEKKIVKSNRKSGFQGFRACMKTLTHLYQNLCTGPNPTLVYLPTYKLLQDHLELFFGQIRGKGGYNNNPTPRQFKAAYKKTLLHMALKDNGSGNCIPLEKIGILTCSSSKIINNTSQEWGNGTGREIEDFNDIPEDHDYVLGAETITEFSEAIVEYVAGFVARRLTKALKCSACTTALTDARRGFQLIDKKDRGGLVRPSRECLRICLKSEKIFRRFLAEGNGRIDGEKLIPIRLAHTVLKTLNLRLEFTSLDEHSLNQDLMYSHKIHLINSIAELYFRTRVHHVSRHYLNSALSTRMYMNKLLLFKGM